MVNIEAKIRKNYERFNQEAGRMNNLCDLRSFTYAGDEVPDYSKSIIRSYYNLKYLYGYTYEYMTMYSSIFGRMNPGRTVSVLSIGCGAMPDYLGLKSLPQYRNGGVNYMGVDLVNWEDCPSAFPNDLVNRMAGVSAADYFDSIQTLNSDILVFPKSISEFDENEVARIENRLGNIQYGKDRLCLCATVRNRKGPRENDMERLTRFAYSVSRAGYVITGGLNQYYHINESRGLCTYEPSYSYPQDVLDGVISITDRCRAKDNCMCAKNCSDCISRKPILRTDNICYMIIYLERRKAA